MKPPSDSLNQWQENVTSTCRSILPFVLCGFPTIAGEGNPHTVFPHVSSNKSHFHIWHECVESPHQTPFYIAMTKCQLSAPRLASGRFFMRWHTACVKGDDSKFYSRSMCYKTQNRYDDSAKTAVFFGPNQLGGILRCFNELAPFFSFV